MLVVHFALWFVPPVLVLGFAAACANYALMTLLIGPYLGTSSCSITSARA
jgi:hypothetical protein